MLNKREEYFCLINVHIRHQKGTDLIKSTRKKIFLLDIIPLLFYTVHNMPCLFFILELYIVLSFLNVKPLEEKFGRYSISLHCCSEVPPIHFVSHPLRVRSTVGAPVHLVQHILLVVVSSACLQTQIPTNIVLIISACKRCTHSKKKKNKKLLYI